MARELMERRIPGSFERGSGGILQLAYNAIGRGFVLGASAWMAWRRGLGDEVGARDLAERLALPAQIAKLPRRGIWVHAASVGEVRTVAPLVEALDAALAPAPSRAEPFVTTATVTGRAAAESIGHRAALAPLDAPSVIRRFLDATAPRLHVVVETEIWPERMRALERAGVPAALVSARLSESSWPRYDRLASIYRPALARFRIVSPRSDDDRQRLLRLGVPSSSLAPSGNLKWDAAATPSSGERVERLARRLSLDRTKRWIVLASVHPGEVAPFVELLRRIDDSALLVAPRHPQRFDEVERELGAAGAAPARASRSDSSALSRVVLLDEIGTLRDALGLASVTVLGGTFVTVGGHNPLEAAAAGSPVVAGPETGGQRDLIEPLETAGGLIRTRDFREALDTIERWLGDETVRRRAGEAASDCLARHRGHARRLADMIAPLVT